MQAKYQPRKVFSPRYDGQTIKSRYYMKRVLLAALAIAVLPLAAQAGDLSYNYLQAGYDYSHADKNGNNAHGWDATASAALGEHFQVFGGGATTTSDDSSNSRQSWTLGGGFHTPVGAQTDFVGDLAYHHGNIDGVSGHVNTYTGEVGVRSAMAPKVEGWADGRLFRTRPKRHWRC